MCFRRIPRCHDATARVQQVHPRVVPGRSASMARAHGGTPPPTCRRPSPDDLVYVIHASGSTGRPKGVRIERRSLTRMSTGRCGSQGWTQRTAVFLRDMARYLRQLA
ncbi:hypothetical protein EAO69_42915 [Streptomyces sp. me109]|uniref:AMP-binding protein n=2 Tax=Streptomyces TaxID=1883 RepID=UPI0011CEA8F2|nr:AMP-binding protein [Streptomyces sp. me109]TXS57994.1 hypothetical protein EAO69_42915 [Streptomyces sp. me109]